MVRGCLVLALFLLVASAGPETTSSGETGSGQAAAPPAAGGKPLTPAQQKFLARFTWDSARPPGDLQADGTACNTGEPDPAETPGQKLTDVKLFIDCMAARGWRYQRR
jgi:hypothetical protein